MKILVRMVFFLYLIFIINSCSSKKSLIDQPIISFEKTSSQIPAGIDSAVALKAKIKADRLFVSPDREQLADSLTTYSYDFIKITEELFEVLSSKKEQLDSFRLADKYLNLKPEELKSLSLEENKKRERTIEKVVDDSLTITIVNSLLDYFLNHCNELIQRATELNPFNLQALQLLAISNIDKGQIFKDTLSYRHSIQTLNKFLTYDRGKSIIYHHIGQSYFELKNWQKSYEFFKKAKEIYVITSFFEEDSTELDEKYRNLNLPRKVDPAKYFDYLYRKGVAEVKVHKADSALATLKQALPLAPTKNEEDHVKNWIKEYILWDGGNIYAAEQRDIIRDSLNAKNYKWAKDAYVQLLPNLKTKKAKDDITWMLARVEYYKLDQIEEAGDRLYNLVINADTSKVKSSIYKAPDDSLYKKYFKDCGEILFRLGSTFKDQGLQDKARIYFSKDTTFEWSGRGKAFLPLAALVDVPENIDPAQRLKVRNEKVIKILGRAKMFIKDFTEQEVDQLYRPLIMIYQQMYDRVNAQRNFNEWNQIKQQMKSGS
jgi:tetratricopeptide (TPR) repeat protein